MSYDFKPLTERTWTLIEATFPGRFNRDTCCFLWAAALAEAMKPHGVEMVAGGALLLGQRIETWGIMVNPATRSFYVTCDSEVDEDDRSYNGHCWVARKTGQFDWDRNAPEVVIYDAMGAYTGKPVVQEPMVIYHPKPALLRSIKRAYKDEIAAIRKAVRKDTEYLRLAAELATVK